MNEDLTRPYMRVEMMALLKSIGNLKASGLDGMPAFFYREYWKEIAKRVTEEVLNGALYMPEHWNDTMIVLIPKVRKPKNAKDR
jgi:hypothetical protein